MHLTALEIFKAQSRNLGLVAITGKPVAKDTNENPASSSQTRQSGVNPNSSAGRPEATDTTQRVVDNDWPNHFKISAPR